MSNTAPSRGTMTRDGLYANYAKSDLGKTSISAYLEYDFKFCHKSRCFRVIIYLISKEMYYGYLTLCPNSYRPINHRPSFYTCWIFNQDVVMSDELFFIIYRESQCYSFKWLDNLSKWNILYLISNILLLLNWTRISNIGSLWFKLYINFW